MIPRRTYVDGPFGQIHVRHAGEGGKPLLCLHQSPLTGGMFDAAVPSLTNLGYHVIAPDTPGYGLSDAPPAPTDISGYAACLPAVINHFGYDAVSVLGHHTGAVFAARFAIEAPDRVAALILNGVPILSEEEKAFFATLSFAPIEPKEDGSHLLAAWNQRLKASPGWTRLDVMHRYNADMISNPDKYFWAFDAVFAHDIAADIAAIGVPTALLTNTGEDLYAATQRAAVLRPDFAFDALEGGTHDIVDEQPEAWSAMAHALLQKISRP